MDKNFTQKQHLFVCKYIENNGNGVQAARDAGYNGSDVTLRSIAKENLTKPHIRAKIRTIRDSLMINSQATSQAKREMLWQIAMHNSEIVTINKNGTATEGMRNPSAVISAIAELNKMDGDYAPRQVGSTSEIKIVLDNDDLALAGQCELTQI